PLQPGPLRASDVQVRYRLVYGDGSTPFCNYGNNCDVSNNNPSASGGNVGFSTTGVNPSPHLPLPANSRQNAVAIEVRLRNASGGGLPAACGGASFNANCRWFYTGGGAPSPSVAPTDVQILASPVQRAFRGNSLTSSSVQWLRLNADRSPCGSPPLGDTPYPEAASQPTSGNSCFYVEMGLKGGIAKDANEQPTLFNDGIGSSQMGSLDCDPNINQGQVLIIGVIQGCGPFYAKNPFDWTPLCPQQNSIFATPNPGAPWDDGRWPPLRCIKTRPTGSMNQLERGLDGRLFGNQNQNSCPATGPGFVMGRNYWDKDTNNGYTGTPPLGYQELPGQNTRLDPNDPRIVTIFLAPTEAFAASGQDTYPITGFIEVYITGYGRVNGNTNSVTQIDDPCPGSTPPTDLDLSGGSASGYAVWGHILNYALPNAGATGSGVLCNPGGSTQPCVPVLVE
ncbi:MAG: hypothetical protein HW391_1805, partial [Chloroflexi bacterium]|nr:hypothetical protein [Chloroflexota bacterium]